MMLSRTTLMRSARSGGSLMQQMPPCVRPRLAGAQLADQVLAHLFFDGAHAIPARAQLADGRRFGSRGHVAIFSLSRSSSSRFPCVGRGAGRIGVDGSRAMGRWLLACAAPDRRTGCAGNCTTSRRRQVESVANAWSDTLNGVKTPCPKAAGLIPYAPCRAQHYVLPRGSDRICTNGTTPSARLATAEV